ncbi:hypothetical protein SK128_006335, partial [Halocaridina rubra]
DSGKVNMLSTVGDTDTVKSKKDDKVADKPSLQEDYNNFMAGVDLFDQLCASYPFNRQNKSGIMAFDIL